MKALVKNPTNINIHNDIYMKYTYENLSVLTVRNIILSTNIGNRY